MLSLAQNLRYAFRLLGKAPGFTLAVVGILAVGIGATTAIFSLVEGVLLRPLPFKDPDRLVLLGDHLGGRPAISVTAREIGMYKSATGAFSSVGGYITASYELSGGAQPEEINAARLSADAFLTLGVQPMLGRVFTQQEEDAHLPLAVISYDLWRSRYNRDPSILGGSIVLDRKTYSIIGVMPRSFEFPVQAGRLYRAELWIPLSLTPDELSDQHAGFWGDHLIARLKDGNTVQQGAQDADRVARQIMGSFPASMSAIHIRGDVEVLREYAVANVRPLLRTLFFAVSIVLLIACVNVSGLLLVRAIRRRRDYAVRLALGAPPTAILRESVLEGLLLSFAGGLLGLAFAATIIRTALRFLPDSMPRIDSISIDATVATFALSLALVTGALCSMAPAFAALRTDLMKSLKQGTRIGMGAAGHRWLRSVLVVSEVAIALVLLTIAGAFLLSYEKMRAVDPGFQPDHVLVARYQLPLSQYSSEASAETFSRSLVDSFATKPGIRAVGITNFLPGSGSWAQSAYTIEGVSVDSWKLKFAAFATSYGDYFKALGIRLLEGRTFSPHDDASAPLVVIVNESMAKHSWPGQSPIGKRMHAGNPQKGLPWATVVGVVADTKIGARDEASGDQWYVPELQPATLFGPNPSGTLTDPVGGYIAVSSALPPEHMTQTFRSTVAEIDPLLALKDVRPMTDAISNIEAPRRFNTVLIAAFAIGALLFAVSGIYAVVAFSASLRTPEIAVRMALGAQPKIIARLVLVSGAKLALLGCGLGVLGSIAASRIVSSFLFEVSATDPFIYLACILLIMLMALLASALPAVRAASADPMEALRSI